MRVRIVAVGTRMPGWVTQAYEDYIRRLRSQLRIDLVELPVGKNKNDEGKRLLERVGELLALFDHDPGVVPAPDDLHREWRFGIAFFDFLYVALLHLRNLPVEGRLPRMAQPGLAIDGQSFLRQRPDVLLAGRSDDRPDR